MLELYSLFYTNKCVNNSYLFHFLFVYWISTFWVQIMLYIFFYILLLIYTQYLYKY